MQQRAFISILPVVELEGGVPIAAEGARLRRTRVNEVYEAVEILPFGWSEADTYRQIEEALGFARSKIIDRMIAAQAIVASACLATLNPRDFRGIPGLEIQDWSR